MSFLRLLCSPRAKTIASLRVLDGGYFDAIILVSNSYLSWIFLFFGLCSLVERDL
jgi:hypothetical protein